MCTCLGARSSSAHFQLPCPACQQLDIISPSILGSADKLREQYIASQPYTHCVMRDLCQPKLLAAVRDEIVNNIQATYKETDLFKVFQTGETELEAGLLFPCACLRIGPPSVEDKVCLSCIGDLGNLDRVDKETAAQLPMLMALKEALYSPEFRVCRGCRDMHFIHPS